MAAHSDTLLATHPATDLDGYAALVALRHLYPGATLVLDTSLEPLVRDVVAARKPPMPVISPSQVEPSAVRRLVLADAAGPGRVGPWAAALKHAELIIYDHHPRTAQPGAKIVWGDVGSACTVVTEELAKAGVTLGADDATLLLAGLYEDTGQLGFRNVVERDFAAALQLVRWGAVPADAGDLLQKLWDFRQAGVFEELRRSLRAVAWGNLHAAVTRIDLPFFVPDLSALASRLEPQADALFVVAAVPEKVFVLGRALRPGVDVAPVIAALGGGGHPEAASALLKDMNLVDAETALAKALAETGAPALTARDIMSSPPITVDAADTLAEAHRLLTAHRIGAVVVTHQGGVIGLLAAATAAGAVLHGFGAEPVGAYCSTDVPFAAPETGVPELRSKQLGGGARLFVVGTAKAPLGVVTRRDLLRVIYEEALPLETAARPGGEQARGLAREIRDQLGAAADAHLRAMGKLADSLGVALHLVGGSVRDLVLRRRPVDWDLIAVGEFDPLLERLRAEGATVKTHGKFHTAHVRFADGTAFDIARARREVYVRPGALPAVEPADLIQDLYRRDFTINAMAVDLGERRFGRLVDRFGGLHDLKRGKIRVLHSLSFLDDPTRAFRALRLAGRFGFTLTDDTQRLLERAVALRIVAESEGTRLRRELLLAFDEPDPVAVLRAYDAAGLLRACHPDYRFADHEADVRAAIEWAAWYRLQFGAPPPLADALRLGALALAAGAKRGSAILHDFKLPADELARWRDLVEAAHAAARQAEQAARPSAIAQAFDAAGEAAVLLAGARYQALREPVVAWFTHWRGRRPAVDGADLRALGVPQGPQMGRLLADLQARLIDGEVGAEKQAQLAYVRARIDEGLR